MEQQASLNFDICENRHRNAETSVEANPSDESKAIMRIKILNFGRTRRDFTIKDVCAAFGTTPNDISGRLGEMVMDGGLIRTGEKRKPADGGRKCFVYKVGI